MTFAIIIAIIAAPVLFFGLRRLRRWIRRIDEKLGD